MRELIRRHGPCALRPEPDSYSVLLRSIISQQISTKAAVSVGRKLWAAVAPRKVIPRNVAALSDDQLRECGLSGSKARFVRALTDHALGTPGFFKRVAAAEDQEVRDMLLPIPGIGPWTVEMFLIFGLGRPDVFPVGDLGLQFGVRDLFGLTEVPRPGVLTELAEPWRPHRTVATWYLWRSRDESWRGDKVSNGP